jgi:hypothetical protein
MTLEELARRVWQAEHRVMQANGRDIERAEVVLSPNDWADVVTAPRERETWGWVEADPEKPGVYTFRGHVLRMDPSLEQGDVRMRTEVFA